MFVNGQQIVMRPFNSAGGGAGCRASDGVSGCSGSSCYYGPNGFAKPNVFVQGGYPYVQGVGGNYFCQGSFYGYPHNPIFPTMSGNFPTGQGCPSGDGDDGAGSWDY